MSDQIRKQEQRYYDRAMAAEAEVRRLRFALEDIASFSPIPTAERGFNDCIEAAKAALSDSQTTPHHTAAEIMALHDQTIAMLKA